jgi:hypothetical protein
VSHPRMQEAALVQPSTRTVRVEEASANAHDLRKLCQVLVGLELNGVTEWRGQRESAGLDVVRAFTMLRRWRRQKSRLVAVA